MKNLFILLVLAFSSIVSSSAETGTTYRGSTLDTHKMCFLTISKTNNNVIRAWCALS